MNFYDFFYIMEATIGGEDPMNMNVDDVQLQGSPGRYVYAWKNGNDNYSVEFGQTSVYLSTSAGSETITRNAYSIVFSGPNGVSLTGRGQALTIYKGLIKGVKKLIDQVKPEGLQFYGAVNEQELMYHTFYEKFLHHAYTAVDPKNYLANWFLEQLKTSGDRRWAVIEAALAEEQEDRPKRKERLEQEKAQKRERRQQAAEAMRSVQPMIGKIAWSNRGVPVYLERIDADNQNVATRVARGRRLAVSSINPTDIKPIDEMPGDQLPALQKLVGGLKRDGITPQFHGNPPDGWDQTTEDPLDNIDNKIAYTESYGPVYVKNYDDYYNEVTFWYMSGNNLQSGYVAPDKLKPIDQIRPEQLRILRKLIKKMRQNNGSSYTPQFYGNPPDGWDQEEANPMAGIERKIAYSSDFQLPVYITSYDDNYDEVNFYYMSGNNAESSYNKPDKIKKIEEMPQDQGNYRSLRKLVKWVTDNYGNPQFYGTPPSGWDQRGPAQPFVGKIINVSGNSGGASGPAYVEPQQDDDDDYVKVKMVNWSNRVVQTQVRTSDVEEASAIGGAYIVRLQALIRALEAEGIRPQFHGQPPAGLSPESQSQTQAAEQARGKVALVNNVPMYIRSISGTSATALALRGGSVQSNPVQVRDIKPFQRGQVDDATRRAARDLVAALYEQGYQAQLWVV